jgi:hypothetical protein
MFWVTTFVNALKKLVTLQNRLALLKLNICILHFVSDDEISGSFGSEDVDFGLQGCDTM